MMLRKLFHTPRARLVAPKGSIPVGQRIYAVGDIHGRFDLLVRLLEQIEADDAARPAADTTLIFLGDLVDRGPQSYEVVEHLRMLRIGSAERRMRFIAGNHEEVFLSVLGGDKKAMRFFLRIGGRETVLSYGISEADYTAMDLDELREVFLAKVPTEHATFLSGFEDLITIGDYTFVHAGIRPKEPLSNQRPKDLRWIREEFLSHAGPLEKIVVHGHTIADKVEVLSHRIGLDTGAYISGKLTAMGFENDERWVIDTAL